MVLKSSAKARSKRLLKRTDRKVVASLPVNDCVGPISNNCAATLKQEHEIF